MKSFREQFIECCENGTCKKIECPYPCSCPRTINLCTKYLEVCSSGICREERMTKEEKRKYNKK